MAVKTEYHIVTSTSSYFHLQSEVQRYLDAGWSLQGGVAVSSANMTATALFCQAMTIDRR